MNQSFELTGGVALYQLRTHIHDALRAGRRTAPGDRRLERGEGVISTAIAVLIIAFLGAAMWVAFNAIWTDSEAKIRENVETIGG